jgi:hypothetical protein
MAVSYPLAFPAGIWPKQVKAQLRRVQSVVQSPFTLKRQVYDWGAARWEITVTMQTMDAADAAVFGQFLNALDGVAGTFTFDLNPWCPGVNPAPGGRTFALKSPDISFDATLATTWEFQFDAVEDV